MWLKRLSNGALSKRGERQIETIFKHETFFQHYQWSLRQQKRILSSKNHLNTLLRCGRKENLSEKASNRPLEPLAKERQPIIFVRTKLERLYLSLIPAFPATNSFSHKSCLASVTERIKSADLKVALFVVLFHIFKQKPV